MGQCDLMRYSLVVFGGGIWVGAGSSGVVSLRVVSEEEGEGIFGAHSTGNVVFAVSTLLGLGS